MESLENANGAEPASDNEAYPSASVRGTPALFGMRPEDIAQGIASFDDLPMHDRIREAIRTIGWQVPTPVQKLCLPFTLRGRDVAGFAQTGTGKTAVFLMTIVNRLLATEAAGEVREHRGPRAIVIAPTRELAMQIEQDAEVMLQHTGLSSLAVFGGIDYDKQARRLKEGVDIIFATPGRLKDYVQKKLVKFDDIMVFVCDEADRMFDMGFIEDVEFFLERIPEAAQKLLFSATTNEQVKELAFEYLETPEYISVNPEVITPEKIEQHAIHCHATDKLKVILGLLREHNPDCSIVFTNTKLTAEWLHFKLSNNGIDADLITGDLPQKKRIRLIQRIKEGKLKALIATDVASRGLHISRVTHVYNFDLPDEASNYVHRIGRTARAGAKGHAYSLVCDDYGQNLAPINEMLGETIALRTEWPDERYLAIEDKAGNPFEDRYRRKSHSENGSRHEGGRHRDEGGGPRAEGGRHRDEGGGPRGGGQRGGGDRPRRASGEDGGQRRQGGRHAQGDGQRGQGGQRGGRGQGRGGDHRRPQHDRQDRPRERQEGRHASHQHSGPRGRTDAPAATQHADTTADKGVGSMIKKLVKALFGFGK